jgi:hypothetical protein
MPLGSSGSVFETTIFLRSSTLVSNQLFDDDDGGVLDNMLCFLNRGI